MLWHSTRYPVGSLLRMTYNALNLPERAEFSDGSETTWAYTASGVKLEERHVSADGMSDRVTRYLGGMVFVDGRFDRFETPWGYVKDGVLQFHAYIRDYQGSVVGVVNTAVSTRPLTQFTDYYPYGLPHDDATGVSVNRRKFGGKEYMTESGLNELDYGARHMLPQYGLFTSPDPKAIDNTPFSPWSYCNGDPVNNTDPTGMAVLYRLNGDYIGHTSEGFTGDVLIYTGSEEIDFSQLTQSRAYEKFPFDLVPFDTMVTNNDFTGEARSKIWTHVISQFEGKLIFDQIFFMNRINGGKIYYGECTGANWETEFDYGDYILPTIYGKGHHAYGKYPYESTVENIASSVIVHEWYSHGVKHYGSRSNNHRHAIENVIKFIPLWQNTTANYKRYNLDLLKRLVLEETGSPIVGADYIFLYNKYIN